MILITILSKNDYIVNIYMYGINEWWATIKIIIDPSFLFDH